MVVTAHPQSQSKNGSRPININKDIPQVIKLLELCFGSAIQGDGHRIFTTDQLVQSPAFIWRISPAAAKLAMGFVWEEDGRIVGNVTVLNSSVLGRYLVVNVAVHPDFRRRHIARNLMEAVKRLVDKKNGHEILLQVVSTNKAALNLYERLEYTNLGSVTGWSSNVARIRRLPLDEPAPEIRELKSSEWQAAYELDTLALDPDLNWPDPPEATMYRQNWMHKFLNFINGRQIETWSMHHDGQLTGLASVVSEWGRTHHGSIRVHPQWRGQLERPLLAKLIRRLSYLPRRNIRIYHPDNDERMNQLLKEANFHPQRTLTHMKLTL